MTRDLLMIFNPRRIEECLNSFARLKVDKAWLTGYTEAELVPVIAALTTETNYERYIAISDDCVVTQKALDALQEQEAEADDEVLTGWCNLDLSDNGIAMSNVIASPFTAYESVPAQYDWVPVSEIHAGEPLQRTWFAGMCMTSMTKLMWYSFPFALYGGSCCSDFELSWRLQAANVPVWVVRGAGVLHVKEVTGRPDQEERKRLVLLGRHAHVRMDLL